MMKVLVLVSMIFALGFGCATDEQEPLLEDGVGQVEQQVGGPCSANYMCPLGNRCYPSTWTCGSFPVFGPSQNSCIDDLQCHYQFAPNSHCYYSNPLGSYGECLR